MEKHCAVCGKLFTASRQTQKYCSAACRRYANRHGTGQKPHKEYRGGSVIRTFRCVHCGKLVRVTDPKDGRTKFCSLCCERNYWKHPKSASAQAVEREFYCRNCGRYVHVTDPGDRRRIFCSRECSHQWFDAHRRRETKSSKSRKKSKHTH